MSAPSTIIKGVPTIIWGPANSLNLTGAIVESISVTPKNSDPIEIEDNEGFTAVMVLLLDGFNAKISCVYDRSKAWPADGANIALNLPVGTGSANANLTSFTCLVASQAPSPTRKKEMMIDFNVVYRPGCAV